MAKIALITGATGALGDAVASRFLAAGYRVVGADRAPGRREGISWIKVDLADHAEVRAAIGEVEDKHGPIDALVHCAGGFRYGATDAMPESDWAFLLDANLRSTFNLLQAALPAMEARGRGSLVFVGANAALHPSAGMGPYCASKAGLHALVQSAAAEVKNRGITVNAVLPSIIDTPANRQDMPKADFTQWVSRESLAEIVFSLTQEWGKPVTGALIPVTGRL